MVAGQGPHRIPERRRSTATHRVGMARPGDIHERLRRANGTRTAFSLSTVPSRGCRKTASHGCSSTGLSRRGTKDARPVRCR
jgi:hypothetical protein